MEQDEVVWWRTGGVDEGVPDGGPAAAGGGRALDLERRRGRPEDEALGEGRPAQPARVRRGARASKQRGGGQQQHQQPRRRHHLSYQAAGTERAALSLTLARRWEWAVGGE